MLAPHPAFRARRTLLRALRDPTTQQCINFLGDYHSPTGPVCYMGLIMRQMRDEGITTPNRLDLENEYEAAIDQLAQYIGTTSDQHWSLVVDNDKGVTFPEIADKLEALPLCTASL